MVSTTAPMENAGEGSSRSTSARTMTLGDAMRAPSANPPVVVLDSMHRAGDREEVIDPKEDLWLTSADGRFNSPIIPLRVGTAPDCQTFYVHKSVLIKAEFFKKALCGEFMESEAQAMELPEEDPAIFHFVVAFLYENKYVPIKAASTVLIPDDTANARREDEQAASDSDSSASILSDSSTARSLRRRERRRRRENRHWERERRKHPGTHRPGCGCRQCLTRGGPPCWNCMAPRIPPPPPGPMPVHMPPGVVVMNVDPPRRRDNRRRRPNRHRPQSPGPAANDNSNNNTSTNNNNSSSNSNNNSNNSSNEEIRIQGQDLRTWLLTYELNIDVYICANKFLLDDFKAAIARSCIDMLETAGADAAQASVLRLCRKLYEGLPESDRLLRMIFARVGFLNPHLWRRDPDATAAFFHAHPEVGALMFKETLGRREEEHGGGGGGGGAELPAMERPVFAVGGPPPPFPPNDPRAFMRGQRWRGDFY
ncbi:uncharacterized protein F4807DRAFT_134326 [Annulohypoxylon truncatum]|uniref:uncharacterized protein n=1 Tax=Annulohypoxylon truncatum TaxID=327061 RepID=UPI002008DD09|nr:uncharacterized protein F4807DRAFT_134326 [Annulohypoxylon truncatum]KAI1208799.1 hypothetical protein F4807DRAFT_134326 [Annulohypoxylon truncatum]